MRKIILALAAMASIGAASFASSTEASAHGWYGRSYGWYQPYSYNHYYVKPRYKRHYYYGY